MVVHADVVIALSGAPLISLDIRLLATVGTILRHGATQDWLGPQRPTEEASHRIWVASGA